MITTHWTKYLPEAGTIASIHGADQERRAAAIREAERNIKFLKDMYEMEEAQINALAKQDWTLDEINAAKFKAFKVY